MLFSKVPAYLIDSENVGSTWISLLNKEEKFELFICVTENAKSLNYSLLKELTDEHRYKINIIECKPGKNSLDFYLSSYLGWLIGKNRHSSYVVVSQDTGYDAVIEYWNKEGYDVKRINTKPEPVKKTNKRTSKKKTEKTEPKKEAKSQTKTENKANSETRVIVKDQTRVSDPGKEKSQAVKKEESPKKPEPVKEENKTESSSLLNDLLKDFPENEIEEVRKYLSKVPSDKRNDKNYIYRGLIRKFKSEKGLAIYTLIKKDLDKYYQS